MVELQQQYIHSPHAVREMLSHTLRARWNDLDEICYELYEVSETEWKQIADIGRTTDRIELINGVN